MTYTGADPSPVSDTVKPQKIAVAGLRTPSGSLPIVVGDRDRIVEDQLQWILERRVKTPTGEDDGYRPYRYHRNRDCLLVWLRVIRAPPAAIKQVETFPEWHP